MPQITFNIKSKVDVNQVISSKELRTIFLSGIPLDKLDQISDDTLDFYINSAINYIENRLTLKLNRQIISETKDFSRDDWNHWVFIKTTYPAVAAVSLMGYLGTQRQTNYPVEWISTRVTSDGVLYSRNINLVPNQNAAQNELIIYSGIYPNIGYGGQTHIPNYWQIQYVTGFCKIPPAIIEAIGMLAAIPILMLINDYIVKGSNSIPGIGFGVSSNSISLDGLSQNTGNYVNGNSTIFSAKIKLFSDMLFGNGKTDGKIQDLYNYYGAITFGVF